MSSTKGEMVNVLIAAVLWGSSGICAQYIMEQSQMSSQFLTMTHLIFAGLILLMFPFVHDDKVFSIIKNRKNAISLLIFSVVGTLTAQLTFLLIIEKSSTATATVLQLLSPTIVVAWFSVVREAWPGILVPTAVFASFIDTLSLVTHGDPASLSISSTALFWGITSVFTAAFYTTYPSTLIARYGTLPVVGWNVLVGSMILLPFYAGQDTDFLVNGSSILVFFYLVVIGTSLVFNLYLKDTQMIGGPKASILSYVEPLSIALLSLLLSGTTFTLPDWLGTFLILSSVILILMNSHRRARAV